VYGEQADSSSGDDETGQLNTAEDDGSGAVTHESIVQIDASDGVSIYA